MALLLHGPVPDTHEVLSPLRHEITRCTLCSLIPWLNLFLTMSMPLTQVVLRLCMSQMGSQEGTTAAQLRQARASFEAEYGRLPSPQWQLAGELNKVYDTVLEGLQERQRKEEASRAAASAAEADRRVEQVWGSSHWLVHGCACPVEATLCCDGVGGQQGGLSGSGLARPGYVAGSLFSPFQ